MVRVAAVVVLVAAVGIGAYALITRDGNETVEPAPAEPDDARAVLTESITRSTDGIVALLDNGDIVTMNEDGTNRRVVLEAPGDAVPVRSAQGLAGFRSPPTLAMAPSGNAVYVARPYEGGEPCPPGSPNVPTTGRITRVPLDGSPPRDVADGLGPAVSGDGRYLAFITNGSCDEAESLADAVPAVASDDSCEQWPMVAAGADIVTTRNAACDITQGFLSVTDAETEATSSLDPGTPPSSILVDLNTEGGRLLLVEYDVATDASLLVAWSPDAGRVELGDGIAAGVWILNEDEPGA